MGNTVVKRGSPEDTTQPNQSDGQHGNQIVVPSRMMDDNDYVFPDILSVSTIMNIL